MANRSEGQPLLRPTTPSSQNQNGRDKDIHDTQEYDAKYGGKKKGKKSIGDIGLILYERLFRQTFVPLALMVSTPNVAVLGPHIIVHYKGDWHQALVKQSWQATLVEAWKSVNFKDMEIWTLIIGSMIWALLSVFAIGGRSYYGPLTKGGFRPEYSNSGVRFFIMSMLTLIPILMITSSLHLYYKMVTFCGCLTVFGLAVCILLYIKGLFFPSPGEYGSSGNPLFDFYWGIELYPRLLDPLIDLKQAIICRFGMWFMLVIALVSWKANYELYSAAYKRGEFNYPLLASTLLQTIYMAKFYWWEDGYMNTIDIMTDRFGFYTAWGCIAFVPSFFTLPSLYLVRHSPIDRFGLLSFIFTMVFGVGMIVLTYWADYQKQVCRATNGKCDIWGRPAKVIRARYLDETRLEKRSVLLASGFWGVARHINYFFELMSGLAWCLPALDQSIIPYTYVIFLAVLVIHRERRDDDKCQRKYGEYWTEYKKLVPYRIIPYIY